MSNSMDAEAIREIERLVNDGRNIRIVKADAEPDGVYYLQAADGKHERVVAARKPYRTTLDTPDAFVAFVKGRGGSIAEAEGGGVIFYTFTGMVFQLVDDYKGDRAECPLGVSPQLQWLEQSSKASLTQEQLVRLLRITFDGCVTDGSNLLAIVRQVKFSNGSQGESIVQHGKQSMSRAIQAQVMGVDAIPEEVKLTVPVWENWHYRATVRCAVEVDASHQMFQLTPFPLSLQRAKDVALAELAGLLTADGMPPAYLGKP